MIHNSSDELQYTRLDDKTHSGGAADSTSPVTGSLPTRRTSQSFLSRLPEEASVGFPVIRSVSSASHITIGSRSQPPCYQAAIAADEILLSGGLMRD